MIQLFEKIAENIDIKLDLDSIQSKFIEDQSGYSYAFHHPSGKPHWQNFSEGISFTRNFYINFKNECDIITAKIDLILRNYVKSHDHNTEFSQAILNHKADGTRLNLIKILAGTNVRPHCDVNRNVCINIGLKNSNSCRTNIKDVLTLDNFYDSPSMSYVMNDGDVYLLNVKYAHSVTSNVAADSGLDRYIITYNLSNVTGLSVTK